MDFCYVGLRAASAGEFDAFKALSTRAAQEWTGSDVMGRGLGHFTRELSTIFCHYADALKPGAPFVFTYHNNDPSAYIPIVVAILDAGLDCVAALPVPGETGASLHITRTKSSVLDSVLSCRKKAADTGSTPICEKLQDEIIARQKAGLRITEGDVQRLLAGHIARKAVNRL